MQLTLQVIAPAKQHEYPTMATLFSARHSAMRQERSPTDPDISSSLLLVVKGDEVLLLLWCDAYQVTSLLLTLVPSYCPGLQIRVLEQVAVLIKLLPASGTTPKHWNNQQTTDELSLFIVYPMVSTFSGTSLIYSCSTVPQKHKRARDNANQYNGWLYFGAAWSRFTVFQ